MLIDTHSHIYYEPYENQIDEIISRANKKNISKIICVGTDIKSSIESIKLSEKYDCVYATVGVHPHDTSNLQSNYIYELEELSKSTKVVAIGETGLDYFYNHSSPSKQKECFIEHIELSQSIDLPLIIHNRNSDNDMIKILNKYSPKGVIHCFTGNIEFAQRIFDLGMLISFTGIITFKNSNLEDVIKRIKNTQFLIETDSPYLTPEPFRGKLNEPSYVSYVAKKIAEIRNITVEEVAKNTTNNAYRLFKRLK